MVAESPNVVGSEGQKQVSRRSVETKSTKVGPSGAETSRDAWGRKSSPSPYEIYRGSKTLVTHTSRSRKVPFTVCGDPVRFSEVM